MKEFAYQCDADGNHLGMTPCQPNPMAPGEFLLPNGATWVAPPEDSDQVKYTFDFSCEQWLAEDAQIESLTVEEDPAPVKKRRRKLYS